MCDWNLHESYIHWLYWCHFSSATTTWWICCWTWLSLSINTTVGTTLYVVDTVWRMVLQSPHCHYWNKWVLTMYCCLSMQCSQHYSDRRTHWQYIVLVDCRHNRSSPLVQEEGGEWFVWKVFERDTFGSNKVYQEMLIEGRKKGLSVAGNRTLKFEMEVQRLQKKVNIGQHSRYNYTRNLV